MLSEVVNDKLNDGIKYFWLGGRRESGEWRWSDNSSWGFTNWRKEYNTPTGDVCLYSHGYWEGRKCFETYSFKCKADYKVLTETEVVNLTFTKEQLTFSSFHVWYKYKAVNEIILESKI